MTFPHWLFVFMTLNRSPKGKCSRFDQGQISHGNVFMDGLGDEWNLQGLLCSFLFLRDQMWTGYCLTSA